MVQVHGSCVEIDGRAVLLRGPPGSGKSDLALRLIDGGARLVADDRCNLALEDDRVVVTVPPEIEGLIEVRGLGVMRLECVARSPLGLVVDLVRTKQVVRLPRGMAFDSLGVAVPLLKLAPFEASASVKVRLALKSITGDILSVP